ncbi:MAG TPA: CHAT domain-containing protein [Steroidobacteraceae bacterium]|nr:CHAT domain-containing protein [Steroidobacteraceae bacterium]
MRVPAAYGSRNGARAAFAGVLLCLGLAGCGRQSGERPLLEERCLEAGTTPELRTSVTVPRPGVLHIQVRQHGISTTVSTLRTDGSTLTVATPIQRTGTLMLGMLVTAPGAVAVRIRTSDTPDIRGAVCLSATLAPATDARRLRAEAAITAAGAATAQKRWEGAFRGFLRAAQLYDALGATGRAAASRHAAAELAYSPLRRPGDSYALVAATLPYATADDDAVIGARLTLLVKASLELAGTDDSRSRRIEPLLAAAAQAFERSGVGARELPRLATLEGFYRFQQGDRPRARELFAYSVSACQAIRDWECFARARMNLAALAEDEQNYSAALQAYEDALKPLDAERVPGVAADIADNLGRLEARAGLESRAEESHLMAMRLYARVGDCDGTRRSASSLGDMLARAGSGGDASLYLRAVVRLSCPVLLAAAVEPAGIEAVMSRNDSTRTSVLCAPASIGATESIESQISIFRALLALAELARGEGAYQNAQTCLARALPYAVDALSQVRLANARGDLLLELARPQAAEQAFSEALRTAEDASLPPQSEAIGTSQLGIAQAALSLGKPAAARLRASAAFRAGSARGDVGQIVAALRIIASEEAAGGQSAPAARTLRLAVSLIEQVPADELDPERRASFLATQHAVFAELTDLLAADQGAAASWMAFSIADEGHARSLRYAAEQAPLQRAAPSPSESGEYARLLQAIAALGRERAGSNDQPLLEGIGRLAPAGREYPGADRAALTSRLRAAHADLLEFAVGRTDMYAFVVGADQLHVVRLGSREAISQAASALTSELRSPEPIPKRVRTAAARLSELVLWPLSGYLTQSRLMIVPDDALHTIPFAVLPWSRSSGDDLLIAHAEVASVASALMMERVARDAASPRIAARFVLLGDPVFRRAEWLRNCNADSGSVPSASAFEWLRPLPSLPGTRAEVLGVAEQLRRARANVPVDLLLGCRATGAALASASGTAELLHIATHGIVDARRPRLSALALTPDSSATPDAAFRLLDILALRISARLVVLSACDTSRGRLLPGEGVLGLAQAFVQAGADSVLASFWRVEDSATAPFMHRFYGHLLDDGMTAAGALRASQLELSRSDATFSWAAFGLYGRSDSRL